MPILNQYQLKKISSFLFTISQLLLGAVVVQIFEVSRQGRLDSPVLVVLIFYIVNAIIFLGIAAFVAGKVKDKYA